MTHRIRGKVKLIHKHGKIFGVIMGDDLRDYFFIPSLMQYPHAFHALEQHSPVEFMAKATPTGLRAVDISVLISVTETTYGESSAHQ